MKFTEVEQRAMKLVNERHEIKFYEMILCFALEELFLETDEIELSEQQFNELLSGMVNYLANDYHESPWHVADAITNLIKKYGLSKTLEDCSQDNELLEKELENF